ncbi:hypothetical protein GPL17_27750 [Bradyrhizobium yuanmingense]|uniref:hypothetical protein n=1 Tax=Bradyrhizobium TaxID=374 RepID=UPI0012F8F7DB|nr:MULTISPECIES: hypothetical protein [Bradyrhizobium]MDF0492677.1 hypothetical protein [Bradyrhizobium yuanmingense]MDF0515830.1 hypothetical protein [Bradyrhizobium yuanmingense]MVT54255.1 hypothetical protein [Bradyrhizobium yuanmingense]UWU70625.1 hypothetical protein N2602_08900 [Bradyrhizobium sp. NC92]
MKLSRISGVLAQSHPAFWARAANLDIVESVCSIARRAETASDDAHGWLLGEKSHEKRT